jgi:hypothetical protein
MLLGACAMMLASCTWLWLCAGLYLFNVGCANKPAEAWVQLQPSACLAIPDVLVQVPLKQQQEQQQQGSSTEPQQQLSGLLVVGSKCSSSQVLGLPHAFCEAAVGAWPTPPDMRLLPTLQSALQPNLAGAQAVAIYQDPTGEDLVQTARTDNPRHHTYSMYCIASGLVAGKSDAATA